MKKNLSALKRTRIALRNRTRNKMYKSAIKRSIKQYLLHLENNKESISSLHHNSLSIVYKKLDKAVQKGILHKNQASRRKSRLAKLLKSN